MNEDDVAAIDELRLDYQRICDELSKVIVDQKRVIARTYPMSAC